jgi:hypothetical protein
MWCQAGFAKKMRSDLALLLLASYSKAVAVLSLVFRGSQGMEGYGHVCKSFCMFYLVWAESSAV